MIKISLKMENFNPFHATGHFRYLMKTSENQRFSNVFGGVSKETSGMKWFNETKMEKSESETAEVLNNFFSDIKKCEFFFS